MPRLDRVDDVPRATDLRLGRLDSLNLALGRQVDEAMDVLDAEPCLLVTGPGGVGKSAMAGRALRRLVAQGWAVAVHYGRWLPTTLFYAVGQAVNESRDDFPGRAEALEVLAGNGPDQMKLDTVCDLLACAPLALVFDDLGENLTEDGSEFVDPGFGAVFDRLCATTERGRLLVTSRLPMPTGTNGLRNLPIAPLDEADALRLASQFPRLGGLDAADQETVVTSLCGHPRLLALADTWLAVGVDGASALAPDMLLGLVPDVRLPAGSTPDQVIRHREAAVPILRAVLLTMHLHALDEPMREMLLQAALSTVPISARVLAAACGQEVQSAEDAGYTLVPRGLASPGGDWELYVGPWVAEGLSSHQGDELSERHERAMTAHHAELQAGRTTYPGIAAIARHLVQVPGDDHDPEQHNRPHPERDQRRRERAGGLAEVRVDRRLQRDQTTDPGGRDRR